MKRHKRTWGSAIGLSILMLALVSCGGLDSIEVGNHDAHSGLGKKNLRLTVMNSCPDVLAELQAREIKRMEDEIDRSAEQMVEYCTHVDPYDPYRYGTPIGVTVDTSSYQPGTVQSYNSPPRTQTTGTNTTSAPSASVLEGDRSSNPQGGTENQNKVETKANDFSETNTQVKGVDEADYVKTDGTYVYIVAGNVLQIWAAFPPVEAHRVAVVPVDGTPKRMFVSNDRLVLYSSQSRVPNDGYFYPVYGVDCTYGYDCDFLGDGTKTVVSVYDITDRSKPTLERELRFGASYISSRRIANAVYTVLATTPHRSGVISSNYYQSPVGIYACRNEQWSASRVRKAYEELKAQLRDEIKKTTLDDWLPTVTERRIFNELDGEKVDDLTSNCEGFLASGDGVGSSFLQVSTFDLDRIAPSRTVTVLGTAGAVYASTDALYVAARRESSMVSDWYLADVSPGEATILHKFALAQNPSKIDYIASGAVKGRILNQFSMDEYQGYLRIATTTGHLPSAGVHSTLSIVENNQGVLEVVGQLDQLAPKEDIRSVRFDGTRGFMVTFKKTDPLFVFDLADPRNPKIKGELKIPGFSTYMHMLDDNHILSIGYDADDQGSFAWFTGIKLQIFDVSDLSNPKSLHVETIGTRGSTSEAATNHLAFNYFAAKGLLALPINICESVEGGDIFQTKTTFVGLLVYRVSIEKGFELVGRVSHWDPDKAPTTDSYADINYQAGYSCHTWWTQSASMVKRSIIMDDFVYSIADDQIKVQNLDQMGVDVKSMDLMGGLPTLDNP